MGINEKFVLIGKCMPHFSKEDVWVDLQTDQLLID